MKILSFFYRVGRAIFEELFGYYSNSKNRYE